MQTLDLGTTSIQDKSTAPPISTLMSPMDKVPTKSKIPLRIQTGLPTEPVPIPNARQYFTAVPPDSPPLTACSPECTEDDYELLDHLQNDDNMVESIATV